MFEHVDRFTRRNAMTFGLAAVALSSRASTGHAETAVGAGVDDFAKTPPEKRVQPDEIVNGLYELEYTENYAQGLRALGLPDAVTVAMLSDDYKRLGYRIDGERLTVTDGFAAGIVDLGRLTSRSLLGASFDGLLAYFDRPDRLVTTFTGPSGLRAWSVKRFSRSGMINMTIVEATPKLIATRVWRRAAERPGIPGIVLG